MNPAGNSTANNTIQIITAVGALSTYTGNGTPGFADGSLLLSEFNKPLGLLVSSSGVIVVADNLNNRIRVITL